MCKRDRSAMLVYKGRSVTDHVQQNWDFDDLIMSYAGLQHFC